MLKKRIAAIILSILVLFGIMYGEYRYIMCHLSPYRGERGTLYIEIFGQVDEYYAAPVSEME